MRQELFSNELKKQAWEKMNEILDKELPQKKRKLRFLFLLFPIVVIAGFVLFKSVYANNSGEKKEKFEKFNVLPSKDNNYRKTENKLKNNNSIPIANDNEQKTKKHFEFNSTDFNKALNIDNQPIKTVQELTLRQEKLTSEEEQPSIIENENTQRSTVIADQIPNNFVFEEIKPKIADDFLQVPMEIQNPKKRKNWLFHPYCGVKLYNSDVEGLSISSEINAGNVFYLNNRFLLDFSLGYTNSEIIYSSVEVLDNSYDKSYKISEILNESVQIVSFQRIKYSIFEFSFHESYRLSRIFTLSAGGGIALTKKVNSILRQEEKYVNVYSGSDLIKPVTFLSDINIQYNLNKNLTFLLGYKYYFKNYSVFKDVETMSLRSAYLKKESNLMNFNLGMRYNFR